MTTTVPSTINLVNEQIIASFCIQNSQEALTFNLDYFLHPTCFRIVESVQTIIKKSLHCDVDTVYTTLKEKYPRSDIEISTIQNLKESYSDFKNIHNFKRLLYNDWIKHKVNSRLLEDLLVKTNSKDYVEPDDLARFANELLSNVAKVKSESVLLQAHDLVEHHREILIQRSKASRQRSLGFRIFDEKITRPAAAGEITILGGLKGTGKSTLLKTIENNLINRGICVVSFAMEMSEESDVDRLICIREGLPLKELQKKDLSPRMKARVDSALDSISKLRTYMYCPQVLLSFDNVYAHVKTAKEKFRELGVLPEDDYMVLTFDLLPMIRDFGDQTPSEIEKATMRLHQLTKEHRCHSIGLVQINENKLRGKVFKRPEEIDEYRISYEDIKGGSAYSDRARVVMTFHRPLLLKRRYFPEMEELWDVEPDILQLNVNKHNDGEIFATKFLFGQNFRITPFVQEISDFTKSNSKWNNE